MNHHAHTINDLFQQLGLPSEDGEIHQFVKSHPLENQHQRLDEASFWSPCQAGFIKECWQDDSEWCQIIDDLDARLRP